MAHIIRNICYAGWKNCISISNTVFETVICTEVGPRILRYGKVGGPNLLWINEFTAGQTEETKTWRAYGGHSFDSVINGEAFLPPENIPVPYSLTEDGIVFEPMKQGAITKSIKVRMCRRGGLEIIETLTNSSDAELQVKVWGNTLLRGGGFACLPGDVLIGAERPELKYGERFAMLRQNLSACDEYEVLLNSPALWCGYFTQGSLFIMTSPPMETAKNGNLSWSVTSNRVQMSSFSPSVSLKAGESLTHTEVWNIFADLPQPKNEEQAEAALKNNRFYYDFVKKPVKGLDY